MRRSTASSNWPGPFFAVRYWAGCTTNMFGFDLRQAQPRSLSPTRSTRVATPARSARSEVGLGRWRHDIASSATTAREKLKLPLTSALRQKQTQFASSSSNGGDVTSKLSRHRRHSFLPLRKFDQQLGLPIGPFAGFCRLHCCPGSGDRKLHQLRPRFGRDEGGRSSPLRSRSSSRLLKPAFLDRANPLTET
jgi:hypothetical protein